MTGRRTWLLAALLAALALTAGLVATSAFADKAATADQKAAVAAAAKQDPACVTVRISSVDEAYALLYSNNNSSCEGGGDGFVVYHLVDGEWQDIYEGSGPPTCPKELPAKVGIDFKICSGPSKKVYVARGSSLVYKPSILYYGAHAEFKKLRWTGWGTATAVAHGTMFYSDAYETFTRHVRIKLTSRGLCGEKRTYKHMNVHLLDGTADDRKAFDGNSNQLGCGYSEY